MAKKGIKIFEEFIKISKADYHIHTNYSDGKPTPLEVLEYVENHTDLTVISICDHDTIEGALKAKEIIKTKNYRFELIIGEEVTTKEGHIIGLFLKEKVEPGLSAKETVKKIKEQNGLAIADHPFQRTTWNNAQRPMMNGVGFKTLIEISNNIDAIEIINSTPTLNQENIRAAFINSTMIFQAEVGGSDAHILEAIGKGYTLFEGKTARDFRWAIRHHQTRAMLSKYTILALIKYGFFFFPQALRIAYNTLLHGRKRYPEEIV